MSKEFLDYTGALELKELGFDEPCFGYYVDGELRGVNLGVEQLGGIEPYYQRFGFHTLSNHNIDNTTKIVVTAPTFSQAFRFFREKYNLICRVDVTSYGCSLNEQEFYCEITSKNGTASYEIFNTYEESELDCLKKLIEIVEQKKK
jgi:hypothetical protein